MQSPQRIVVTIRNHGEQTDTPRVTAAIEKRILNRRDVARRFNRPLLIASSLMWRKQG